LTWGDFSRKWPQQQLRLSVPLFLWGDEGEYFERIAKIFRAEKNQPSSDAVSKARMKNVRVCFSS
jgi:hypothetical protein